MDSALQEAACNNDSGLAGGEGGREAEGPQRAGAAQPGGLCYAHSDTLFSLEEQRF